MRLLGEIERIHKPSVAQFREQYVERSRPVVISGLTDDWDAGLVSPQNLRARFGDLVIEARQTDDEFEYFFGKDGQKAVTLTLRAYIDAISARSSADPRPPYFGNISLMRSAVPEVAALRGRFVFPPLIDRATEETRLWIAGDGQRSTIHNDPYPNLNAQLVGRKQFLLFRPDQHFNIYAEKRSPDLWISPVDPQQPDLDRYPRFHAAEAQQVVLEPGETLFIPTFWWHQARAVATSININTWSVAVGSLWSPLRARVAG